MNKHPENFQARIEVSRGGFVKFGGGQSIDFISPVPCPYNYGCLEHTRSEDGEPIDVVVLGSSIPRGEQVRGQLVGVVYFRDAGLIDDKLLLRASPTPLSPREQQQLQLFFRLYAAVKRIANVLRRRPSPTAFEGIGDTPRQALSFSEPE
jgi:inorganic pyrophosphatase